MSKGRKTPMYPKISVASPAFELYVPVDDFYGAFLLDSRCATFRTAVPTLLYVLWCVVFLYYAVVLYRIDPSKKYKMHYSCSGEIQLRCGYCTPNDLTKSFIGWMKDIKIFRRRSWRNVACVFDVTWKAANQSYRTVFCFLSWCLLVWPAAMKWPKAFLSVSS